MNEQIRAADEELLKKGEDWGMLVAQGEKLFLEIAEGIDALQLHFSGAPVTVIRKELMAQQEKGKAVLLGLKAHIKKLETVAGIYQQTERGNRDFIRQN